MPLSTGFDILVDARSLQDIRYSGRGIGRLASNLLAGVRSAVPALQAARFLALIDPALPPLAPAHRALFDGERSTARPANLRRPAWFVELSPMTHDPLFAARLLDEPEIFCAAVVYDFIPYDAPEHYLSHPEARLEYHVALAWLPRYHLFLPISESTAARLGTLLGVPERRIVTIGAPLDPVFAASAPATQRCHVLAAGGTDPRKNVECPLRAHAISRALQAARVPLLVTGNYSRPEVERLSALYAASGGDPSLIRFAGEIDDVALAHLYRAALAIVVASRAEGFSLPVIEAMASDAPVFASAIPVHAELISDPSLLFPPDDPSALARLLERLLLEPAFATNVVAAEKAVWPRFRAESVRERFWGAIAAHGAVLSPAAPAMGRRRSPRVALLTPLPPARSGIADYAAASVHELGRRVELHLFTATPEPAPVRGAVSISPLSELPFLTSRFDRVVGVIGNSRDHLEIFHLLLRHGGAAIAHDARMLGFYRTLLGMERTGAVAAAELEKSVTPAEIESWLADEVELPALFFGELAAACAPLIFHSPVTARLAAERYRIAPHWLAFSLCRPWPGEALQPAARQAARGRLGVHENEIVLASFGYGDDASQYGEECIWVLEMLRGWGITARLVFVGAVSGGELPLRALAERLALADRVQLRDACTGEAEYRDWLLAADLAIQLRRFGFGSIAGTLSDCIAASLPTIANAPLAEAMDAPSFVRTIPDPVSPVLLANAAADLIEERAHRTRPLAAMREYAASHNFARYAEGLCGQLGLETVRREAA